MNTDPAATPSYDVVVVSYNQRERLLAALGSVSGPGRTLIVVDNDSRDGSADAVRDAFPQAHLIALDRNIGFGAAVNRGVAAGTAPFILLLNNDARLRDDALDKLTEALADPDVAAAGPRLLDDRGAVELSVDRTLSPWNEAYFKSLERRYRDGEGPAAARIERRMSESRAVTSLTGACMLIRRSSFESVGGFDERFFLYAEDVDLCARMRAAGQTLHYVADAVVEHDRGASSATAPAATAAHYRRSQIAFYRKHRGALATSALRLYLALRFSVGRLVGGSREQRRLSGELLRLTLRESGK